MLSRCSGDFVAEKKPSHCRKECQQADWKNHKPFCVSGAECSVIDDGIWDTGTLEAIHPRQAMGSSCRLRMRAGPVFVSSSTMDVKTLKEVRDSVQGKEVPPGFPERLRWNA